MNGSEHTPVKATFIASGSLDEAMAITPQHTDDIRDVADAAEEELMGSFSALKVTYPGLSKRLADNDTVEGSPVNVSRFKRQDLHPTPQKFSSIDQPATIGLSSCPSNVTKRSPHASLKTTQRKLLVICSASEEHNTGDHQENALRTALLCGPEGCLRRPELKECIEWINSDNLTAAPLTDLLR